MVEMRGEAQQALATTGTNVCNTSSARDTVPNYVLVDPSLWTFPNTNPTEVPAFAFTGRAPSSAKCFRGQVIVAHKQQE